MGDGSRWSLVRTQGTYVPLRVERLAKILAVHSKPIHLLDKSLHRLSPNHSPSALIPRLRKTSWLICRDTHCLSLCSSLWSLELAPWGWRTRSDKPYNHSRL